MLQSSTLRFLTNLKKNNNKPWFESHKPIYLQARQDMEDFVQKLIDGLGRSDKGIAALKAKECVFRIYRDVRFSKDKTPYKISISAAFNGRGKNAPGAGYYLHCEPGNNMVGGGMWMPTPEELAKIRQEIDYNFDEWKKMIGKPAFKRLFPDGVGGEDSLSRPPKGYEAGNPAIEYLKMKSFVVTRTLTDAQMVSKQLLGEVLKTFDAMKEFIAFLNRAVE
jgi:uncharacterized protein (TIGR02453 family)